MLPALPPLSDLVELPALRTALAQLVLLAVAGGMLGAFVVLRRLAFFAHAVGTATFPALVVADGIGFSATVAALATAVGYAVGVERAGRAERDPGDTATGLLLVLALAAGIVLASDVFESGAAVDRLLFGTAIGLDSGDLALSAAAALLAVTGTLLFGRAWTAVGFDPAGASASGLPTARADLVLLVLVAGAAVAALSAVGALLVTSIFVVPAAIAALFASDVRGLLALAVAVATVQCVSGLYISLWLDVPPGPAVAVLGSAAYALAAAVAALRGASASVEASVAVR